MLTTALSVLAAVLLDWLLGEPRRFHPLVGFGRLAQGVERWLYGGTAVSPSSRRVRGIFAVSVLLGPITLMAALLDSIALAGPIFDVIVLFLALGHKSLHDHARPVVRALRAGDEDEARRRASLIVSRDPAALHITRATTESVLENGNDGVFAALFWFIVAGAPGVLLYRLANTLDAMWGYRNQRYLHFGWAAARLDDLLNYVPARLTALTYALLGRTKQALICWRRQAPLWDSPNAGPVMATGAGALAITLGGPACYAGEWHHRPVLGNGKTPTADDIERALNMVKTGVGIWIVALLLLGGLEYA